MTERISIGQLYPNAVLSASRGRTSSAPIGDKAGKPSFQQMLEHQIIRFSHHAEVRLQQRGIEFQPEQLTKLQSAMDKAAAKGAKDVLMLMNGAALIVNVPNRTVVTALDGNSMKDNVFTQIDSAIIIS